MTSPPKQGSLSPWKFLKSTLFDPLSPREKTLLWWALALAATVWGVVLVGAYQSTFTNRTLLGASNISSLVSDFQGPSTSSPEAYKALLMERAALNNTIAYPQEAGAKKQAEEALKGVAQELRRVDLGTSAGTRLEWLTGETEKAKKVFRERLLALDAYETSYKAGTPTLTAQEGVKLADEYSEAMNLLGTLERARKNLEACQEVISRPVPKIPLPEGWRVECTTMIPQDFDSTVGGDLAGVAYSDQKLLEINASQGEVSKTWMEAVYRHEVAHAYSFEAWNPQQRKRFAQLLGKRDFFEGPYEERPAEVFARAFPKCQGYQAETSESICPLMEEIARTPFGFFPPEVTPEFAQALASKKI